MLIVGSCFAGIGGIDLGLEWTSAFKTLWQIENDPYASAVLAKHWPDVKRYGDIRSVDPAGLERVDLICGGYPCQPFSLAGKRGGATDERYLWPEMLRLIRGVRPRLVLLENVPGHLSMGFGRVLGDLAESGFDAEWDCIPASSVGANHRRDRLFVVAYSQREQSRNESRGIRWPKGANSTVARNDGAEESLADTESGIRLREASRQAGHAPLGGETLAHAEGVGVGTGLRSPESARFRRRRSRHGDWWSTEPDVGRVAHGVPSRVDRLTCLGNAVVPQVAEKVGEMILRAAGLTK